MADGVATLSTHDLGVGDHHIDATYSGDPTYVTSTSTMQQTISLISTALRLGADHGRVTAGTKVTFTAMLDTRQPAPKQSVEFTVDGHPTGPAQLDDHGRTMWSTSSLAVGEHTVTARYSGDATHAAATSDPVHVQIAAAPVAHDPATAPPSTGGPAALTPPAAQHGRGGLAHTGADALGITVLALGLLAVGFGLVGLGRRRRARG